MTSLKNLVMKRHVHFPCSMPLQVVTLCHRLLAGEKRLHFIWKSFDEVTPVFSSLFLEAYVVLLYDCTCTETTVDAARKNIFTTKDRSMDNIPPTKAALLQHIKRAIYQGGFVWGQALVRCPVIPSPNTHMAGKRVGGKAGNYFGHFCQKLWLHALNC
ncbi:hypothetical protein PoB_005172000 [Plakobranchus ocellatus]|uniref:Uncharacterized protein n=1 Tax=Plakobranchus ocellatus TaxID=259542 RepID=A0AAV4C1E1_9GAST|nr:hypothetical protein PoB_005172000 [Plakobranchus ocellatus]